MYNSITYWQNQMRQKVNGDNPTPNLSMFSKSNKSTFDKYSYEGFSREYNIEKVKEKKKEID